MVTVLPTGLMLHVSHRAQVVPEFPGEWAGIVQHLAALAERRWRLLPIGKLLRVFQVRTLRVRCHERVASPLRMCGEMASALGLGLFELAGMVKNRARKGQKNRLVLRKQVDDT